MVFFKAQKMQRLAELLQRIQNAIEGEGGDLQKAEDEMREMARTAGLDLEIARMADGPTLEAVLTGGGEATESRRWLAAEVLFVDGLLALKRGDEGSAADRLGKARHLYLTLPDALDLPPEAVEPGERLRRLRETDLDVSPEGDRSEASG